MPAPPSATVCRVKVEFQPVLARLRADFSKSEIALMLGISRRTLTFAKIDVSTARLAYLLARIAEKPGRPIHLFDILTLGEFEMTAEERATLRNEASGADLR